MPPPTKDPARVFVSFASADKALKDQFTAHLDRYEADGDLKVFASDKQLRPGDDWDAEIQKALAEADVVVFLVSGAFQRSWYIAAKELKPGLTAAERGTVKATALWLRPCDLKVGLSCVVEGEDGKAQRIDLKDYEWLLKTTKAVSEIHERNDEREAALVMAAKKLMRTAEAAAADRRARVPSSESSGRIGNGPQHLSGTTYIELRRVGDRLTRRIIDVLGRPRPLTESRALPVSFWSPSYAGSDDRLRTGEELFGALFEGERLRWRDFAKSMFADEKLRPISCSPDLRLIVDDAALLALPWHDIAHEECRLSEYGWRVSAAVGEAPWDNDPVPISFRLPCTVVFGQGIDCPNWFGHDTGASVRAAWGRKQHSAAGKCQIVDELADLSEFPPTSARLVAFLGRPDSDGTRYGLRMADGLLPFEKLFGFARFAQTRALLLTLTQPPTDEWIRNLSFLSDQCPWIGVQWSASLRTSEDAARAARGWVQSVTAVGGADPETALAQHGLPRRISWRLYTAWKLDFYAPDAGVVRAGVAESEEDVRAYFDRHDAKSSIAHELGTLFVGASTRTLFCVTCGAAGNAVEHFNDQLYRYLKDPNRKHPWSVDQREVVRVPRFDGPLDAGEVGRRLHATCAGAGTLSERLRDVGHSPPDGQVHIVFLPLVFDYPKTRRGTTGVFDAKASATAVLELARHFRTALSGAAHATSRLLINLAVPLATTSDVERFQGDVDAAATVGTHEYAFFAAKPLGSPSRREIYQFLNSPQRTEAFDEPTAERAADWVHRKAKGSFEEAVRMIAKVIREGPRTTFDAADSVG